MINFLQPTSQMYAPNTVEMPDAELAGETVALETVVEVDIHFDEITGRVWHGEKCNCGCRVK